MTPARFNFRKALLVSAMALSASVPTFVMAAEPASVQTATQRYSIPAGSLAEGLMQLASAAGVTVQFSSSITEGHDTVGLEGEYTLDQGFAVLLQGSGLVVVNQGSGVYTLRAATISTTSSGVTELSLATVNSNSTNITEGTNSYTISEMGSATGLELSIRETPQSVTVITNQLLVNQNIQDLDQALRLTPGVRALSSGPGFTSYKVRGFNLNTLQIDGQTFKSIGSSNQFFSFNMASVDHIEVVRGATGLTTGSGDPSGVVNLVRKHGSDSFAASINASVANYETYSLELDIGGPLTAAGTVRGRMVVGYEDQNDHIKGYYSKNKPVFYGVIDADIGENTLLSLALDYQEVNQDGLANFAPVPRSINGVRFDPPRSLNLSPEWEKGDIQQQNATLSLVHTFANNWKVVAAFSDRSGESEYKLFGYILPASSEDLRFFGQKSQSSFDANVFDLKVNGSFDFLGNQHDLVLGYNHSNQTSTTLGFWEGDETSFVRFTGNTYTANINDFDPGNVPEVFGFNKTSGSELDAKQSAFFINSKLSLADPLSLLLGGRLSNYEQDEATTLFFQAVGGPPSPFPAGIDGGITSYDHDNVFTPYVGMVYNVGDRASVYASYTEIFELQSNSVRDSSGGLLDPIESVNYELGFKMDFFDSGLTASIAIFEIEQDNLAVRAGEFLPGSEEKILYGDYYYKGEDGRVTEGVELEISGQIFPNWQLMGGYTHQKFEKADGSSDAIGRPEDLFKLATSYQFEGALSKLSMGGSFVWQSDIKPLTSFPAEYTDAFQVVGFWAGYQVSDELSARLNISNLLDEKYTDQAAGYINYGEDRRIRLSVDYQF